MAIANGLLFAMLAINFVNITSRFLFDKGIIWVFPLTSVFFVWMIFFSFFVIYRRGQDVAIDIATRRMPPRVAAATEAFVCFIVVGLMILILAQAPVLIPRQVGTIDLIGIQRYWLAIPFFFSCFLIAVEFVLRLRGSIRTLTQGEA
ncbi:MAG: TRAP transporter small permease [Devosiaceae bacterium]|nr:TRAP transporter small permease [Devosiaceae bacterium MH13]